MFGKYKKVIYLFLVGGNLSLFWAVSHKFFFSFIVLSTIKHIWTQYNLFILQDLFLSSQSLSQPIFSKI